MSMKRVEKGWGYELWVANSNLYCGKLLHFNAGKKCSYHFHRLKTESFYLQSGHLVVRLNDEIIEMNPGDTLHIKPLDVHQMTATVDSDLFEFSTEHFDGDSYRISKGD